MNSSTIGRPSRGFVTLAVIAALALAFATLSASDSALAGAAPDKAQAAKKKCKKGKKSASAAKKCGKKKDGGDSPASPGAPLEPTPLPLTAAEVIQRVSFKANVYCQDDMDCVDSGYYFDTGPGDPECASRSTYTWTCYGWNDEDYDGGGVDETCDFREVVSRVGYNGVTGHQNLTFGVNGWDCF